MLDKSVAALNYKMSDEDFKAELEKIRGILSGEYKDGSESKQDDPLGIL